MFQEPALFRYAFQRPDRLFAFDTTTAAIIFKILRLFTKMELEKIECFVEQLFQPCPFLHRSFGGIVVNVSAKDPVAILMVLMGVEDMEMPHLIDILSRNNIIPSRYQPKMKKTSVPKNRIFGTLKRPSVFTTLRQRKTEFSFYQRKIDSVNCPD